jgi:hypothetical protein
MNGHVSGQNLTGSGCVILIRTVDTKAAVNRSQARAGETDHITSV